MHYLSSCNSLADLRSVPAGNRKKPARLSTVAAIHRSVVPLLTDPTAQPLILHCNQVRSSKPTQPELYIQFVQSSCAWFMQDCKLDWALFEQVENVLLTALVQLL